MNDATPMAKWGTISYRSCFWISIGALAAVAVTGVWHVQRVRRSRNETVGYLANKLIMTERLSRRTIPGIDALQICPLGHKSLVKVRVSYGEYDGLPVIPTEGARVIGERVTNRVAHAAYAFTYAMRCTECGFEFLNEPGPEWERQSPDPSSFPEPFGGVISDLPCPMSNAVYAQVFDWSGRYKLAEWVSGWTPVDYKTANAALSSYAGRWGWDIAKVEETREDGSSVLHLKLGNSGDIRVWGGAPQGTLIRCNLRVAATP